LFAPDRIAEAPERYLARVGRVFECFDQQDSGNVSYGVEVADRRYFVKTAGSPSADAYLRHAERVALLDNAVRLARRYRHPALPVLHQTVESPHGTMLVYDWANGELLGVPQAQRADPASAYQRFRALPVERIAACLDTIFEVHALLGGGGEVAGDFYDGCLIYDFAASRVSLIDLDSYRSGPYRNDMGRMFGSTRFMAPEEFTLGALIDQRTTVFTMGRVVQEFLGDRAPATVREVAVRACQEEPSQRYGSLSAFWSAWQEGLAAPPFTASGSTSR
jgi:serine/threonine protein kinase, bacterial